MEVASSVIRIVVVLVCGAIETQFWVLELPIDIEREITQDFISLDAPLICHSNSTPIQWNPPPSPKFISLLCVSMSVQYGLKVPSFIAGCDSTATHCRLWPLVIEFCLFVGPFNDIAAAACTFPTRLLALVKSSTLITSKLVTPSKRMGAFWLHSGTVNKSSGCKLASHVKCPWNLQLFSP